MIRILRNSFRGFIKEEQGNVIILVALTAFLLILSIGAAVDMTRAQILQLKMYSALDAANLAAGAAATNPPAGYTEQTWVDSEVQKFFNANFPANYLESSTIVIPSATLSNGGNTIDISASGVQTTSFMSAVGFNSLKIGAASEVTRATNTGMELVLALDNTGSMNAPVDASNSGVTKIAALQSAATELVNILYGTNTSLPNLFIGIVPFSQAVNIGTGHSAWTTVPKVGNPATTGMYPSGAPWYGCVGAPSSTNSYDISDDTPSVRSFPQYFYPDVSDSSQVPSSSDVCTGHSWCNVWTSSSTELAGAFFGPNAECPQPLTQMTTDKATVLAGIASMTAEGQTLINLGLAWAYRLLSPKWQGLWGGLMNSDGLPLAYNTPNMQKVLILMTDGTNYIANPSNYSGIYNAYGFLSQGNINGITTDNNAADLQIDTETLAACTEMKNNGIIIYTIGFGQASPDNPPTLADRNNDLLVDTQLLQSCATDANHYFLAPTNAALSSAFQQIGNALANLRLSK